MPSFVPVRDFRSGFAMAAALALACATGSLAAPCPPEALFGPPTRVSTVTPQRFATTADLNRDGLLDLLVSTTEAIEVRLALRGVNGIEYPLTYRQRTGDGATQSAVADFDTDGLLDLAVARTSSGVITFRGLGSNGVGDGTFEQRVTYDVGVAWGVVAVDLDLDGVLDLVASARTGIKFLKGQTTSGRANGTFVLVRTLSTPITMIPKGLVVTDVDYDGAADIVFGTELDAVGLFRGHAGVSGPDGTFGALEILLLPGGRSHDVCVADFNGDSRLDIASSNYLDGSVSVFVQGPNPREFGEQTRHVVPGVALGMVTADVDQDGRPDLVVGSPNSGGTYSVLLNEGPTSNSRDHLGAARLFGPARTTFGLAVADLDGDQRADLIAPGVGDTLLAIFPGTCVSNRLPLTTLTRGAGGRVQREPALLSYEPGTSVTLTALGESAGIFERWSGDITGQNPITTFIMDRPMSVTAEFRAARYVLTTTVAGSGYVFRVPEAEWYAFGTVVQLQASPFLEHLFARWEGGASGTAPVTTVTMDSDKSVTAVFRAEDRQFPAILSVRDAPLDQGGLVRLSWSRSLYEFSFPAFEKRVTRYEIWRGRTATAASGESAAAELWDLVAVRDASASNPYLMLVATANDSGPAGAAWTKFFVRAKTEGAVVHYDSAPDSGCSVDNLPPAPVTGALAGIERGRARLTWAASTTADIAGYRLHRGGFESFEPATYNEVAFTRVPEYSEAFTSPAWYKIAAEDIHGNRSAPISLAVGGLPLGVGFGVARISPNPAPGGALAVRLYLESPERASVELFDLHGRRVETRELPGAAGEHHVTFGVTRRLAAGLYWIRLRQGGREDRARAVVTD